MSVWQAFYQCCAGFYLTWSKVCFWKHAPPLMCLWCQHNRGFVRGNWARLPPSFRGIILSHLPAAAQSLTESLFAHLQTSLWHIGGLRTYWICVPLNSELHLFWEVSSCYLFNTALVMLGWTAATHSDIIQKPKSVASHGCPKISK